MGPGSLFTCFGSVPLTRCKRGDQGERHPPVCPGPGRQAQSRNSALTQMTQGISGSGARRWSVRKHCRAGQVSDNSARWLTCLGGRGKADCGTQAERTWSRGPAGSVPRRLFGSFLDAQKGTSPAGRNLSGMSHDWNRDGSRKTPHPSRHPP